MNLYELIAANTAALIANTAALTGAKASTGTGETKAAAADTKKAETKKAETKKEAKPKGPTRDEMVAALTEVKEKLGATVAKELIADNSTATKMAEIPDDEVGAVCKAALAKLAGGDDEPADDDGL